MSSKTNPIVIILLLIAIALLAYIAFKPKINVQDINPYNTSSDQIQPTTNPTEEDQQPVVTPTPTPTPTPQPPAPDPKITFLKGLVAQYPTGSVKECLYQGNTFFVSNPYVGMADGGVTAYDETGIKVGSCGAFYPSDHVATSEEMACSAISKTCTQTIYYPENGLQPGVDIYNLN